MSFVKFLMFSMFTFLGLVLPLTVEAEQVDIETKYRAVEADLVTVYSLLHGEHKDDW